MSDYGIQIPVYNVNPQRTVEVLRNDPELGRHEDRWLLTESCKPMDRQDLLRVHDPAYVGRLFSADVVEEVIKTYELIDENGNYYRYKPDSAALPLEGLFRRALRIAGCTYRCCQVALEKGFCFYLGGGQHHGKYSYGDGFCIINDIVLSLRKAQAEGLIRNAWVIDLDAHRGDGTAALTEGDDSIRTLSIHMAEGWPLDRARTRADGSPEPSFIPGDIDVGIRSGEEEEYNDRLKSALEDLAGFPKPDLALVLSGTDCSAEDKLPSSALLQLTSEQIKSRDIMVYAFLQRHSVPAAYVMAGSYGTGAWRLYAQFLGPVLRERLKA